MIKNGIDNVEKFQKTSPEYLNTLGVNNGQIYQAKLKKALVTLLPALAFVAGSPKYKNKRSKATSTEATASDTGTALKGNNADSPAQNNQSTKSPTNAAQTDSIKAQTELKLFILSANLPLQFANLMFEVSSSCTCIHDTIDKRRNCRVRLPFYRLACGVCRNFAPSSPTRIS